MIKLVNLLVEVLLESNDVVPISQLDNIEGLSCKILSEVETNFQVLITYDNFDKPFKLVILGTEHDARFGPIIGDDKIDVDTDFGGSGPLRTIRMAIFSYLRYYLDKFNIKHFQFSAKGTNRRGLYKHFMEIRFSDYEMKIRETGTEYLFDMDKKENNGAGETK